MRKRVHPKGSRAEQNRQDSLGNSALGEGLLCHGNGDLFLRSLAVFPPLLWLPVNDEGESDRERRARGLERVPGGSRQSFVTAHKRRVGRACTYQEPPLLGMGVSWGRFLPAERQTKAFPLGRELAFPSDRFPRERAPAEVNGSTASPRRPEPARPRFLASTFKCNRGGEPPTQDGIVEGQGTRSHCARKDKERYQIGPRHFPPPRQISERAQVPG